ncbi:hypothetical protein GGR58DRAFT_528720 [Xylaria digitata]|nr:hypothetical protein GGR58DRAFT_528720 [Xylaria digitata]
MVTSTSFLHLESGGRLGYYYTNPSLEGMRSNGWTEPRSRRRCSRLVLALGPVPVPVPGDAAGCRRQDMGDPSNDGIGDGGGSKVSLARCGGSVAAESRWEDWFRNTKRNAGRTLATGSLLYIFGTKRCARSVTLDDLYVGKKGDDGG